MLALVVVVAATGAMRPSPTRRVFVGSTALASLTTPLTGSAATSYASAVQLADGLTFPLASFGLQIYDDEMAEKLTLLALEAGFRNFFASVLARNQVGFARAVKRCGIPRDELFICGSVVSNRAIDEETAFKFTQQGCRIENSAGKGATQAAQ